MYTKKVISMILAITTLFVSVVFSPHTANAIFAGVDSAPGAAARLRIVFENHLAQMISWQKNDFGNAAYSIEIDNIRTISDFEGNNYTIAECQPVGYMIYHNESGNFVEYSPTAPSPFKDLYGDLRYVGPNEYYVYEAKESAYRYVFNESTISEEALAKLQRLSTEIDNALIDNSNQFILNYVNGTNTTAYVQTSLEQGSTSSNTDTRGSWTYVNNFIFFNDLSNCGYTTVIENNETTGICGYIAAAMLLVYDKVTHSLNTVEDAFFSYNSATGSYTINTTLPLSLYYKGVYLGYDASTTSVAIHYTVKEWFQSRGVAANHTSLFIPFASNSKIAAHIVQSRPVIWFGNISSNTADNQTNISHAVVIYGYQYANSAYSFVAHFGCPGATCVYFSGILGSMYTYDW